MARTGLDRIWTVPNVISFARLLSVPLFFWLLVSGQDSTALIVLVAATSSDFVDGFIARRFNQVTRLGALLDPISDRLFIAASVVALVIRDMIPWVLLAVVLARDVVLLVAYLVKSRKLSDIPPVHFLGKVATFVLFVAFPTIVVSTLVPQPDIAEIIAALGWFLGGVGSLIYWVTGLIYLGQLVPRKTVSPD
ncbi:cardiolipin synthase [Microbacteriaceae bacterium MWH-Ta3]|nr:cardiolipin synthase [Microbacteriaceae bacterium MWH-Ta3]